MVLYLTITGFVLLLYLLYPLYLVMQRKPVAHVHAPVTPKKVSVIFLSRDGGDEVIDKIQFLLGEISDMVGSELIVIDDHSMDDTVEKVKKLNHPGLKIYLKEKTMGIPHSMNMGANLAANEILVFCDQRQSLAIGSIEKLVESLRDPLAGAVSGCISCYDKQHGFSLLRYHENLIKRLEGASGNLMGVYGPLYAIKRECFKYIPDYIILDDLYLSLSVLPKYHVRFMPEITITDDNPDRLYDYVRSKKYLQGLIQLLFERELWRNLNFKQKIMLLWHKYLRLTVPLLTVAGLTLLYFSNNSSLWNYWLFISVSTVLLLMFIASYLFNKIRLRNLISIQFYYPVAFIEMIITGAIFRRNFKSS